MPIFIIGSVGPLRDDRLSADDAAAIYREQAEALIEGGLDALLFETFTNLEHEAAAIRAVRALAPELPVVALFYAAAQRTGR